MIHQSSIINHQPSNVPIIQSSLHDPTHTSSAPPFTQSTHPFHPERLAGDLFWHPDLRKIRLLPSIRQSVVSIPQEGGQVGEFQGEPQDGKKKKRHKSQAFKSLPGVDPHPFFARDGPLEEGMSTMVPTNNSGMPKKKDSQFLAAALQSWGVISKASNKKDLQQLKSRWHSPYILVYKDPFLISLLVSVPSDWVVVTSFQVPPLTKLPPFPPISLAFVLSPMSRTTLA